jgi:hypothetical protein
MFHIIFTKDANTFTFGKGRVFPVKDPASVTVPTDKSDGGQMYAYNKGISEQLFNLVFEKISATDHTAFLDWLLNHAVGPVNTFTFTDEAGATHTVRLLDTTDPFEADGEDGTGFLYSGTIQLREEI